MNIHPLMKKEIKAGLVEIKHNLKKHINDIIGVLINMFLISIITGAVVSFMVREDSLNESLIQQLPIIVQIMYTRQSAA